MGEFIEHPPDASETIPVTRFCGIPKSTFDDGELVRPNLGLEPGPVVAFWLRPNAGNAVESARMAAQSSVIYTAIVIFKKRVPTSGYPPCGRTFRSYNPLLQWCERRVIDANHPEILLLRQVEF